MFSNLTTKSAVNFCSVELDTAHVNIANASMGTHVSMSRPSSAIFKDPKIQ